VFIELTLLLSGGVVLKEYFSKSNAMLSSACWDLVQSEFGFVEGHNLDIMSLDSNTQWNKSGNPLRHITPNPATPNSSGVNVFNQDLSLCDDVGV